MRAVKVTKWLFSDSLGQLNHKSITAKRVEKYTGCPYKEQVLYFSTSQVMEKNSALSCSQLPSYKSE